MEEKVSSVEAKLRSATPVRRAAARPLSLRTPPKRRRH
jgi:hypothetical protein